MRTVIFDGDPKSWFCVQADDDVHVLPSNDLIEHLQTEDCACGPVVEPIPRDDGTFGWLYTHNSLDGREDKET